MSECIGHIDIKDGLRKCAILLPLVPALLMMGCSSVDFTPEAAMPNQVPIEQKNLKYTYDPNGTVSLRLLNYDPQVELDTEIVNALVVYYLTIADGPNRIVYTDTSGNELSVSAKKRDGFSNAIVFFPGEKHPPSFVEGLTESNAPPAFTLVQQGKDTIASSILTQGQNPTDVNTGIAVELCQILLQPDQASITRADITYPPSFLAYILASEHPTQEGLCNGLALRAVREMYKPNTVDLHQSKWPGKTYMKFTIPDRARTYEQALVGHRVYQRK